MLVANLQQDYLETIRVENFMGVESNAYLFDSDVSFFDRYSNTMYAALNELIATVTDNKVNKGLSYHYSNYNLDSFESKFSFGFIIADKNYKYSFSKISSRSICEPLLLVEEELSIEDDLIFKQADGLRKGMKSKLKALSPELHDFINGFVGFDMQRRNNPIGNISDPWHYENVIIENFDTEELGSNFLVGTLKESNLNAVPCIDFVKNMKGQRKTLFLDFCNKGRAPMSEILSHYEKDKLAIKTWFASVKKSDSKPTVLFLKNEEKIRVEVAESLFDYKNIVIPEMYSVSVDSVETAACV